MAHTDASKREELIRAVQAVTWNASNYPPKIQPHVLGQDIERLTMKIVDAVEAVFEQAHTPTDDEREALTKKLADELEYRVRTAVALSKGGQPTAAQVKARAQEYAPGRYREVIYLSEYNAAVSAFVEGATWGAALAAAYETRGVTA